MVEVKLLKEPGYVYDLNFIFYLKFNSKTYFDSLPDNDNKNSDIESFKSILKMFGEIPNNLYVFFHALENGLTFLSKCYIWPYNHLFTSKFDFKFFLKQLKDSDSVVRNAINFYFDDLSSKEVELCMNSKNELFARIKNSSYSDEEVRKLYEFFIDPVPYIETLYDQLIEKEQLLSRYYEKNYQQIFDVFNKTTFSTLSKQVKGLKDLSFLEENNQTLYTSYCLLHKYFLNLYQLEDCAVYLLGIDYDYILEFAKEKRQEPHLDSFGGALGEENRILILQHLLVQEECTCKDFEKVFQFSGSTVYHHVTILLKAGLLKTRNVGKLIFYSINRPYFDTVTRSLQKYCTKQ